jgi:hypothetical protein
MDTTHVDAIPYEGGSATTQRPRLAIGFATAATAFAAVLMPGGVFNLTRSRSTAVTLSVYLVAQVLGEIASTGGFLTLTRSTSEPSILH